MFNYFDSLFFDYCHLEKPKIKNAAMSFTEEEITSFIALILIIISGVVLYCCWWCDVTYHVAIGPVISISALAVLTRMLIRQRNKPSLQQYSEHMSGVRKILERHKISLDDSERIKELIDYASKAMERSNPLYYISHIIVLTIQERIIVNFSMRSSKNWGGLDTRKIMKNCSV